MIFPPYFLMVLSIWVVMIVCIVIIYLYIDRHHDRQDKIKIIDRKIDRQRMCGRSTPTDMPASNTNTNSMYKHTGRNSIIKTERLTVFGTPEEIIEVVDIEIIENTVDTEWDEILVFFGRYYRVEKDNKLTDITDTLNESDETEVRLLPQR